jgi:Holliday junction resolvasome RuvABC endonuclease subunit
MSKNNKVILALDVSSSCTGYAVHKKGRWSKTKNSYGFVKTSSKLTLAERLCSFRDQIEEVIDIVQPTHIIIEDVFSGRNIKTMKLLARFNGVAVELSKRKLGTDPQIALTAQVRSFLKCGKSKEECFNYICRRYNLEWNYKKMNDITDAIALSLYLHGIIKE